MLYKNIAKGENMKFMTNLKGLNFIKTDDGKLYDLSDGLVLLLADMKETDFKELQKQIAEEFDLDIRKANRK